MLTAKENLRQTIIPGGNPDRFVNQYEGIQILQHPFNVNSPMPAPGEEATNSWGVVNAWPEGTPGPFPMHTPDKILCPDIEHWRDYIKAPSLDFPEAEWEKFQAEWEAVDGNLAFKAPFVPSGLFEQTHNFLDMVPALMAFIDCPDEMHDLISYLTEWELKIAETICDHLHPDALFHHDDWGSQDATFLDPGMWAEFFFEPYKTIYGYWHERGVEFIFHHSDSYAATLVPYMIDMGMDVWQGCMETNDVPALVEKYKGKIAFMGNIDNKDVDFDGWTEDDCVEVANRACEDVYNRTGLGGYIPCINQGNPGSVYPGTYMALANGIDDWNAHAFSLNKAEIAKNRVEMKPW